MNVLYDSPNSPTFDKNRLTKFTYPTTGQYEFYRLQGYKNQYVSDTRYDNTLWKINNLFIDRDTNFLWDGRDNSGRYDLLGRYDTKDKKVTFFDEEEQDAIKDGLKTKFGSIDKIPNRPIPSLPYPPEIELTPAEEAQYKSKKPFYILRVLEYQMDFGGSRGYIFRDTAREKELINKLIKQLDWDWGIRPTIKTREDEIEYILDDLNRDLDSEKDPVAQKGIFKMMRRMAKEFPEAIRLDKLDAERGREQVELTGMAEAERETKTTNRKQQEEADRLERARQEAERKRLQDIQDKLDTLTPEEVKAELSLPFGSRKAQQGKKYNPEYKDKMNEWVTVSKNPLFRVRYYSDSKDYTEANKQYATADMRKLKYFLGSPRRQSRVYERANEKYGTNTLYDPDTLEPVGKLTTPVWTTTKNFELTPLGEQRLAEYKAIDAPFEEEKRLKEEAEKKRIKDIQDKLDRQSRAVAEEKEKEKNRIKAEKAKKVRDERKAIKAEVEKVSNPTTVMERAKRIYGDDVSIGFSDNKKQKYMIFDPNENIWVHFGDIQYEDFTKHLDPARRDNYLARSGNIKGDWKDNPYSANNLARRLLWGLDE
jgi:hypothetical protein